MAASWDGCSIVFLQTLNKSKNLVVILLTLNRSKNLVVILLTLNKLKKLATKLPWEKPDAYATPPPPPPTQPCHPLLSHELSPGF